MKLANLVWGKIQSKEKFPPVSGYWPSGRISKYASLSKFSRDLVAVGNFLICVELLWKLEAENLRKAQFCLYIKSSCGCTFFLFNYTHVFFFYKYLFPNFQIKSVTTF